MISLRKRIAVMLAMAAIAGIIFSAPISICLVLELACMLAVGRETFGREVQPVWWAGIGTLSLSLVLVVITPYILCSLDPPSFALEKRVPDYSLLIGVRAFPVASRWLPSSTRTLPPYFGHLKRKQ